MITLYACQIGRKVKNNILLLVIGVVNDTDIHVNSCGLFRKCKKSICQAKTVMSKEQVGEVCLQQMQVAIFQ